jgi:hypothetical protein
VKGEAKVKGMLHLPAAKGFDSTHTVLSSNARLALRQCGHAMSSRQGLAALRAYIELSAAAHSVATRLMRWLELPFKSTEQRTHKRTSAPRCSKATLPTWLPPRVWKTIP